MKYILFPGFSKNNKEWAYDIAKEFKLKGKELTVVGWDHWTSGKSSFNIKLESEKVLNIISGWFKHRGIEPAVGALHLKDGFKGGTLNPHKAGVVEPVLMDEQEYIILAKSVGTRLVATMINDGMLKPKKLILMGIPSQNEIYKEALTKLKADQIVVIQNKKDPFNSFDEMKHFISQINADIKVIEGERNDHSYPYPELLLNLL
jgi:hypothetical protein